MDIKSLREIVKSQMSQKRYIHSLNVSKKAIELAQMYNADVKKAMLSGLLHDITKEIDTKEQLKMIENCGIILSDLEKSTSKLWHSISGAAYVKEVLRINDKEIFDAIRYHTTGRQGMTLLDKIIYIADFISDERDFDGVEEMRKLSKKSLDETLLYCVSYSLKDLVSREYTVDTNTVQLYNELILTKGS